MHRKLSIVMVVLLVFVILLTGCLGTKVKLDYIGTPEEMTIQGYENRDEVSKLMSQVTDMKKAGVCREEQDKVLQEIGKLSSQSTLKVNDTQFICRVMDEVVNIQGIKQGSAINVPAGSMIFTIRFPYSQKEMDNTQNNAIYMNQVHIFSDGTALVQSYVKNSVSDAVFVKIKIDYDTLKYITDYYNSRI